MFCKFAVLVLHGKDETVFLKPHEKVSSKGALGLRLVRRKVFKSSLEFSTTQLM